LVGVTRRLLRQGFSALLHSSFSQVTTNISSPLTGTLIRQRGRQFTTVTGLLPLGVRLIPGGRYTHSAWLRTASDTVSSLGTDPWTPAVSLCP